MTITNKVLEALKSDDLRMVRFEMTNERREKWDKIAGEIFDLLRAKTEGPPEAYMILRQLVDSWEEVFEVKGSFSVPKSSIERPS